MYTTYRSWALPTGFSTCDLWRRAPDENSWKNEQNGQKTKGGKISKKEERVVNVLVCARVHTRILTHMNACTLPVKTARILPVTDGF